ncbi:hypothetical protein [Flavobacterium sp. FlaQc-30]|uniref:hypothetical protein n=1 Tax=Flavobacterium sp. FlaQc-30 TaxID=3374179 RepID=UPI003758417A
MFGSIPFILIILPLLSQLLFGTFAIIKPGSFKFKKVFILNVLLQIVCSVISLYTATTNFSRFHDEHPDITRCGMPLLAIAALILLTFLILLVVIIIQFLVKRWRENKSKRGISQN